MDEKEDLIDAMSSILGLTPQNTRLILNVLVHPDIIEETKAYIRANDFASLCEKFQAPWDCAKEAEAKFENQKHGWLGAGTSMEFDWWCEPCRKRVME
jgi:hypothetical protein